MIKINIKKIKNFFLKYCFKSKKLYSQQKTVTRKKTKNNFLFNVEYYNSVDHNFRYFGQRISRGKIDNFAPEWANYVISIVVKQKYGYKLLIDYGDALNVGKSLTEENRIFRDVCGISLSSTNVTHYDNFKMFFKKNVGRDFAIKAITTRLKIIKRER